MPTYDYQCQTCGYRFERFHGMNDTPVITCPECQGETRRVIGAGAGFIVKSGGSVSARAPQCGREQTCCGRAERCDTPACHK